MLDLSCCPVNASALCSQIINCCEMIYMCPVSLVCEFHWLRVGLTKSPAVDDYVFSS